MIVDDILIRVQEVASDEAGDTYRDEQVFGWINDAVRAVLSKRPDALVELRAVQLTPGTKQSLPADAHKLLGVIRNMGSDGQTPGKAIRGPVSQEDLDVFNPDWHNDDAAIEVDEYIYNLTSPLMFYTIPPVDASTQVHVEMRIAVNHTAVDSKDDDIPIIDTYAPALIEWCLYRLFARDSEKTPNYVRAQRHFTQFFSILGEKIDMDLAVQPKAVENV